MLVTCAACRVVHERKAEETWHCGQCDDCIVRWAYDKAVKDADNAISYGAPEHMIKYHAKCVERWRQTMQERGLLSS